MQFQYQNYKPKATCVEVNNKWKKNTFLILINFSVVLHDLLLVMWIKHFTKSLHAQQKLKTN